jgi:type IV pilus assembly protein PilB
MKKSIQQILRETGQINVSQLETIEKFQKQNGKQFYELVLELDYLTEDQILNTIADELNLPKLVLKDFTIDPETLKVIPVELVSRYSVIAVLRLESTLTVATSDPFNNEAFEKITETTQFNINKALVAKGEIDNYINEYYI